MITIQKKKVFRICLFNINDAFPAGEVFQEPALGLGYLKSYFYKYSTLKDEVEIQILKNNIWNNLIRSKPDVIGISSVSQDYTNAIKYTKKIRDAGSEAHVIIGGIHISTLSESFNDIFDAGVIGEGEETFKELIETIYKSGYNKQKLMGIKGLVFKQGSDLITTGKRDLIEHLDLIPGPDRTYLKLRSFLHVLTARGCPYRCIYCSSAAFWGHRIRFHSASRVFEEMRELIKSYHLKHISIWDDLFVINKMRLCELSNLIKR
jgi:anaerobic magnesium-protoporphyrin IX monomethyl ester cyclase